MAVLGLSRSTSLRYVLCVTFVSAVLWWSCLAHVNDENVKEKSGSHSHHDHFKKRNNDNLWLYALGSTALISAAPFFILFFIPLHNAHEHSSFLKVLLGFAAGGLLGDAFLHLIPHALSPHDHHHGEDGGHHHHHHSDDSNGGHEHDHSAEMLVGLYTLSGIMVFMAVEKLIRILKGEEHHHHHIPPTPRQEDTAVAKKKNEGDDSTLRERNKSRAKSQEETEQKSKKMPSQVPEENIKVAGYLNLAADFTHNFTDGMAIGASYLVNVHVGMVTTATILLHEVPHEIGDFAILVQSGCTKRKAMLLQLVTALGAILGTVFGLMVESTGTSAAVAWILPFTAGGFIYIALVSVMPELLEGTTLGQSIKEIVALVIGLLMMVAIAFLE